MASILVKSIFFLVIAASSISSLEAAAGKRRYHTRRLPMIRNDENEFATVVYWGHLGRDNEDSLMVTCESFESGDIVLISGLTRFGLGQQPKLNLTDHCNPNEFLGCWSIGQDINYCQSLGIKVFLSIGGYYDDVDAVYGLDSEEAAVSLADYLWRSFLGGFSFSRPLGTAVLDGIDLDIRGGDESEYWDVLARKLAGYSSFLRRVSVSGAVQCSIPDPYLDSAISSGALDYVWIKFFGDDTCDYSEGELDNLFKAWDAWNAHRGVKKLFVGIPEKRGAPGYIPDDVLHDDIIQRIQDSPHWGGVMLWSSKISNADSQAKKLNPII